jgi:GTPase SAR1 family protein
MCPLSRELAQNLFSAVKSMSWAMAIRNKMISSGIISSATPVSRQFDILPRPTRIFVTGLDNAGKSTLLQKYFSQDSGKDIDMVIPTIGCNVQLLRCGPIQLQSMDVGGSRKTHSIESFFYKACDALVFLIDSFDQHRTAEAVEEFINILQGYNGGNKLSNGVPILILANKQGIEVRSK